jgi:hypothetical protein
MRNKIITSTLIAASFSFAAPVFASGYGPAPFYHPVDGAPASQRGQSALTLAAESAVVEARESYGSDATIHTQSGSSTKIKQTSPSRVSLIQVREVSH